MYRSISGREAQRTAFTLVELLVVVSIIALLVAIALPSMRSARRVAKRTACATNLHSLGQAMRMYLSDSNDYLPVVEAVPSAPFDPAHPRPSIAALLQPYVQKGTVTKAPAPTPGAERGDELFRCRADVAGVDNRPGPNAGRSYFETEKSSYCFNTYLHMLRDDASMTDGPYGRPVKLAEVVRSDRAKAFFGGQAPEESIWLLRDYIAFHGKAGAKHSTNYAYLDGRVGDLER
jgi:prepilin-type N-terminal cleavage/methylation domain-containing protein